MQYITAAEYGRLHGVSKQRICELVQQKRIPCFRPDGKYIFIDKKLPYPKSEIRGRIPNAVKEFKNRLSK